MHNLVSIQNSFLQITGVEVKKIMEVSNVTQTLAYIGISETLNSFVKIPLIL